ncbi:hypothetical protein [Brevundimonas sp. M20]|uniref:hypothetical protein n=1 Tax=Brevundimonas sp. M20 TaxID=2591463 RepID=UPI001146C397|nr:hypothetical protein [Brevundimonas sp. M20]QDH74203.1 hypothetical protein FKQ52_12695 [Brevundimonas sp. M20]
MVWWWWVVPAVVALLGLMLLIKGLGALFRGKVIGGLLGSVGGAGFMAAATIAALLALDIQTYSRLTYERPVATIMTRQLGPQYFEATVIQTANGENMPAATNLYPLHGDEWRIEAQVLKWKPWANVLGLNTQYRLDRLSGRYQRIDQELNAERSVHPLSITENDNGLPWKISTWDTARKYRKHIDAVDTLYGGAAYMPMADGARHEVWITQSGLIARPVNDAARNASAGGWTTVN